MRSRATPIVLLALVSAACARGVPSYQSLHYVDGQLVYSRPVAATAYEAYLRARLALDAEPPRLDVARENIDRALQFDPRDPHLWTTRAEIEAIGGHDHEAIAAANRALELEPGYPPARRVLATLGQGTATASTNAAADESSGRP